MPENVLVWGVNLILQLQSGLADGSIAVLNFFSFLGYEEWFLLMMPFVFWCVEARVGLRLAVYLSVAGILTAVLKTAFHDPRPYWYDPRVQLLAKGDPYFGLPSGHALIGVVVWGSLAAAIRKSWAWAAASFLIFMIGFSRFTLGVHFPTDVFIGWGIGALLLFLLLSFEKGIVQFYRRFSFSSQVLLVLVPCVVLIAIGFTENNIVESRFDVPASWVSTATAAGHDGTIDPYEKTVYTTNAAVLFGSIAGYTWLAMRGGFDAGGPWKLRILRYLLGMLVAVGLWLGLDIVFALIAEDTTFLGVVLRFIRYGLIGIWAGGFGPAVFIRLGWAKPA